MLNDDPVFFWVVISLVILLFLLFVAFAIYLLIYLRKNFKYLTDTTLKSGKVTPFSVESEQQQPEKKVKNQPEKKKKKSEHEVEDFRDFDDETIDEFQELSDKDDEDFSSKMPKVQNNIRKLNLNEKNETSYEMNKRESKKNKKPARVFEENEGSNYQESLPSRLVKENYFRNDEIQSEKNTSANRVFVRIDESPKRGELFNAKSPKDAWQVRKPINESLTRPTNNRIPVKRRSPSPD